MYEADSSDSTVQRHYMMYQNAASLFSEKISYFTPELLDIMDAGFVDFLKSIPEGNIKAEYLLPTLIGGMLQDGDCTVKVLETQDTWFGVTYKEDKEAVVDSFKQLISDEVYQEDLYADLV